MDDNIHLEQVKESSNGKEISWRPSYIYDFSNMSLGKKIESTWKEKTVGTKFIPTVPKSV